MVSMGRKLLIVGCLGIFILWGIFQSQTIDTYMDTVKQNRSEWILAYSTITDPEKVRESKMSEMELELWNRIKSEAREKSFPPVNAKIDPIWKAIPGYNGLEVDIELTYKAALDSGRSGEYFYIYNEVPAEVDLDDLPPQPIYKGNPNKPMVSLMINVAWGNEYIASILETLEKENIHATFFLDGSWLEKNVDTARQIAAYGHEMSNHAYSHPNMSQLSRNRAVTEIVKTQKLLKQHLGVDNKLFAPPSGDFDEETVLIADELGLKTILWTIDTVDWKKPKPEWIIHKIATRLEPGAMILMHPTASSSQALPGMIGEIKRRGLHFGTVSELISPQRINTIEPPLHF
jgi:probable sporulation protein (polysaccharide deacetylase family)